MISQGTPTLAGHVCMAQAREGMITVNTTKARRVFLGSVLLALTVFGIWLAGRSQSPSAQCRRQNAQVVAYQADARSMSTTEIAQGLAGFDIAAAQGVLDAMQREGCPATGY